MQCGIKAQCCRQKEPEEDYVTSSKVIVADFVPGNNGPHFFFFAAAKGVSQPMTLAFFFLCVAAVVGTSCIQCLQQRTQRSERAGVASWRAKASCRHTDRPQTDSDWSSWLHPPFQHFCRGRNGKHFSCSRKLHFNGPQACSSSFFFSFFFSVSNNYLLQ